MHTFSTTKYDTEEISCNYSNAENYSLDVATHTHDSWEFLMVKNGELLYSVDGNIFDITPGSLIISRPGAVHMLHPKGAIHYERYSFFAAESFLPEDFLDALPPDLHVLDIADNGIILNIFEKTGFYLSRLSGKQLKRTMQSLFHEFLVNILLCAQAPVQTSVSYSNPVVTRAIYFIKDHIREPLTVQTVSDALFITPSHLHHCFIKYMNVTPKQYIMVQKLQRVQQALLNAANPTEICRYYGFRNYSTVYRNYQKIYGCRPSDGPHTSLWKIEL